MGIWTRLVAITAVVGMAFGVHVWTAPRISSPQATSYVCVTGNEPDCLPPTNATSANTTGAIVASVLSSAMASPANGAIVALPGFRASSSPRVPKVSPPKPGSASPKKSPVAKAQSPRPNHVKPRVKVKAAHKKAKPKPKVVVKVTSAPAASVPVMGPTPTTNSTDGSVGVMDTSSWPSDQTTGVPAGTILRKVGTLQADKPGMIIDSVDVSGSINVTATGVVIRNCRVHSTTDPYGVLVYAGGSVRIENCEFFGQQEAAIAGNSWSALNVNIHGQQSDGVKLGNNCLLKDSFIHDFTPSKGSHADGGQMQTGVRRLTVTHNTILMGTSKADNAALMFAPDLGPSGSGPVVVTDNLLGGGSITMRIVDGNNGRFHQLGYTVSGNRFVPNALFTTIRVGEPLKAFNGWSDNRLTAPRH